MIFRAIRGQIEDFKILKEALPKFDPLDTNIQKQISIIDKLYKKKIEASDRFFNRIIILVVIVSSICFGITAILI